MSLFSYTFTRTVPGRDQALGRGLPTGRQMAPGRLQLYLGRVITPAYSPGSGSCSGPIVGLFCG